VTNREPGASTKLVYAHGISLANNNSLPDIDFIYIATVLLFELANHSTPTSAVSHNENRQICKIAAWNQNHYRRRKTGKYEYILIPLDSSEGETHHRKGLILVRMLYSLSIVLLLFLLAFAQSKSAAELLLSRRYSCAR
jgi:hypothetical protein